MEAPGGLRTVQDPLLVRVLAVAVPLTIIEGVFLGLTGYPVEEWTFVAGAFAVILLCSGFLVNLILLVVGKGLYLYGRRVLRGDAVGSDSADAGNAVP